MSSHAFAASQDFQSGPAQVTLLELYTSEGCSSCPPAEAWLSKLKDSPGLWKSVVPVAFHVDYWDHLGWRDPWSSKAYSDRQRAYAFSWGSDQIYTPEFVRDGREWQDWRGSNAPAQSAAKPGELRATSADGIEWKITFTPADGAAGDYEVHAALLGIDMKSDVKAGENGGRHLVHDFVALSVSDVPLQKNAAVVKLSSTPPKDSGKLAVAIWVTRVGQLTPVQATGGWLAE